MFTLKQLYDLHQIVKRGECTRYFCNGCPVEEECHEEQFYAEHIVNIANKALKKHADAMAEQILLGGKKNEEQCQRCSDTTHRDNRIRCNSGNS